MTMIIMGMRLSVCKQIVFYAVFPMEHLLNASFEVILIW